MLGVRGCEQGNRIGLSTRSVSSISSRRVPAGRLAAPMFRALPVRTPWFGPQLTRVRHCRQVGCRARHAMSSAVPSLDPSSAITTWKLAADCRSSEASSDARLSSRSYAGMTTPIIAPWKPDFGQDAHACLSASVRWA